MAKCCRRASGILSIPGISHEKNCIAQSGTSTGASPGGGGEVDWIPRRGIRKLPYRLGCRLVSLLILIADIYFRYT
ncbi:MAG TPA: hypothetical protein VK250_09200 [Nitrososphaeraceae archaeon]|nr:hypothetical protein [Nitrososphaeraceae archaeon]